MEYGNNTGGTSIRLSELQEGDAGIFTSGKGKGKRFVVVDRSPEDRSSGMTEIMFEGSSSGQRFLWDDSDPSVKKIGKGHVAVTIITEETAMEREISIRYRNYKGVIGWRRIIPTRIYYGSTDFHPEDQWLLESHDLDKNLPRTFAFKDILEIKDHTWKKEES